MYSKVHNNAVLANKQEGPTVKFRPGDHALKALGAFYEPFNHELADMLRDEKFLWRDAQTYHGRRARTQTRA